MAIVGELAFYGLTAGLLALITVGLAAWTRRYPADLRRYVLPVPFIAGVLTVAYLAMSTRTLTVLNPEGDPVTLARFVGYFFTYPVIVGYLGWLTGARRRDTLLAVSGVYGFTLAVMGNWFAQPPLDSLTKLLVLGTLVLPIYVLLRPMSRAANEVSDERALLYGKLRNLLVMVWVMYLVVGLTSRQGMGLLDAFTGVYMGFYLDLIGHIGFAYIFLRHRDGIRDLVDRAPSPRAYLSAD